MSFFCSIEKSTTGTIVNTISRRLPPTISWEATNTLNHEPLRRYHRRPAKYSAKGVAELTSWFVTALVSAGRCRFHSGQFTYTRALHGRAKSGTIDSSSTGCIKTSFFRRGCCTKAGDTKEREISNNGGRRFIESEKISKSRGQFPRFQPTAQRSRNRDRIAQSTSHSEYVSPEIMLEREIERGKWKPKKANGQYQSTKPHPEETRTVNAASEHNMAYKYHVVNIGTRIAHESKVIDQHNVEEVAAPVWTTSKLAPQNLHETEEDDESFIERASAISQPYPSLFRPKKEEEDLAPLANHGCSAKEAQTWEGDHNTTKEELLSMVDDYDHYSITDQLPLLDPPDLSQPERSGPVPSDAPEDDDLRERWFSRAYVWPAIGEHQAILQNLREALIDMRATPQAIYSLYRSLEAPRIPYLFWTEREMLLRRLGIVERKEERTMLQYMSVIDDMKSCEVPISTWQWNIAISLAAKFVSKVTDLEVHRSLRVWREMEAMMEVKSNEATFNILFDVATKAGKFNLGEMIYKEMEARGFSFNRFHHVSMIYFKGLKGDGEGVRAAYKDLVLAGELVDTIVLNCLISSFIRVGEPQAAEMIYSRMKAMHEKKTSKVLPPKDWHARRQINLSLVKLAQRAKKNMNPRQAVKRAQGQSIIAPDSQTYHLLISHVAVKAGDLARTVQLLDEMRFYEVPLRGSIFTSLFTGFALHGSMRYSRWTAERLENVWTSFMDAVRHGTDGVYIGRWCLVYALVAFSKVISQTRALEIFEQAKPYWHPEDDADHDHILHLVRKISEGPMSVSSLM